MNIYFGLLLVTPFEESYTFGQRGAKSCSSGSEVIIKSECEIACAQLQATTGTLKDGKSCYISGRGECRQDGRLGRKAFLICKLGGNQEYF